MKYIYDDYEEKDHTEVEVQRFYKLYRLWCVQNNQHPEVEHLDEISELNIGHVVYHARIQEKLTPVLYEVTISKFISEEEGFQWVGIMSEIERKEDAEAIVKLVTWDEHQPYSAHMEETR